MSKEYREIIFHIMGMVVLLFLGYIVASRETNPKVETKPTKCCKCFEYIRPCTEEQVLSSDVPDKCWIEED